MSRKTNTNGKVKRPFEFCCDAPDADEVYLAGNFNEWHTDECPLTKDENGLWKTELPLDQGRFEFNFIVDGEWRELDCCKVSGLRPNRVVNEFGTTNHQIEVV